MADRPDWSNLKHTYGTADDIPDLLEQMSPDPSAKIWGDLWERLYHQDTVYSASFAVIPYMLEAALQWPPTGRLQPICFAGAIVAAKDVVGTRDEYMDGLSGTIQDLLDLTVETLTGPGLTRTDRIYLLSAALAFKGYKSWALRMEGLTNRELPGVCPHCQTDLNIVIGEDGFFVTGGGRSKNSTTSRSPIAPAVPAKLRYWGGWLQERAMEAGDPELADWVCYMLGSTACPSCGYDMKLADVYQ